MSAIEKRFRRNFVVACIIHAALIGGIVIFEGVLHNARSNVPDATQLIIPADILGDLPTGPGMGRGDYAPPPLEPASEVAGDAADEQPATKAKPAPPVKNDPNDIVVPTKKPAPVKKPTVAKPATAKKPAATTSKPAATAKTESTSSIRQRFASALAATEGGNAGGDNNKPGGGDGVSKYGRLGNPDGAADGIAGGIGKGSPFWSYYMHVHDRMYEAWEQPGQSEVDKKMVTTIVLRIARDGRIDGVRLDRASGNKLMDDSALAAARSVPRLDPLPEGLGGDYAEISVNFRLEG